MRLLIAIAALFLTIASPSANAQSSDDIDLLEELFENIADNPDFIAAIKRTYNLPPDRMDVIIDHARLMFAQEGFPRYLAQETLAAFPSLDLVDQSNVVSKAQEFGANLIQSKVVLGLRRLSPDERRSFFNTATFILESMSAKDCAGSMQATLSAMDMARAEMAVLLDQDDTFIRDYLALVRKAGFAEIFDDPVFVPLDASERQRAQESYEEAFIDALATHPRSAALIAAADMSPQHPDADVCAFGILAIETALGIDGMIGDLVVSYISE